ncbi:DNA polymerase III subunit delta [Evansella cellulosilytica]|uniref:DNA polymerase III subunit delta n=1 Tax=Evansella cellulosilytica (strain ATCC 21833 / DSM 2522 / FERM P-1141 / JCM 9156 / N-4) TaxID=649639 RepID=E6TW19_EVAC2|nr:DNA polymerase III subunit delta [Evansella cellulosilytica]ADU29842.1 DNA polymerase III, delta subunit [Evansella cellulosilytica DSM 2522]
MAYIDIVRKIKKGHVASVYVLTGTEQYILEDTIHLIIKNTLADEEKEFNLSTYDMKEYPIELAVEEAYTFPFMGGKRVVIVKDAYFLTSQKVSSKIEHNTKQLEGYLENPAPETVLILLAPYEKLDERKKIVKLAKKAGEYVSGSALEEKDLKLWIMDRARDNNVTIDDLAIEQLVLLTSAKLMILASEIKKLAIHVGDGGRITEEIVNELVPRSLEQNIFSLVEGVVRREISHSWAIFLDLIKQKEEPLKIIALMVRQFRILYQVKQLTLQGYSQKQIAGQLKLHPYVVKLAMGQAKQFNDDELLALLDELANMDYEIKTGKIDKVLAVEIFFSKRAKITN